MPDAAASFGPWAARLRSPRFRNGHRSRSGTPWAPVNASELQKQTGAAQKSRARAQAGTRYPPALIRISAVIDVDVDAVRHVDVRAVPEAKLAAEDVQQHEHDDDQQDDGQHAASSAATGLDDGRVFAFHVVAVIISHETLPVFPCFVGETNELLRERFQMTFRHHLLFSAAIAVASCGPQRQPQRPAANESAPVLP